MNDLDALPRGITVYAGLGAVERDDDGPGFIVTYTDGTQAFCRTADEAGRALFERPEQPAAAR